MPNATSLLPLPITGGTSLAVAERDELRGKLERWFGESFALWDGTTGALVCAAGGNRACDRWNLRGLVCRQVAERGDPEFIEEAGPLALLAIPICGARYVALGAFAIRSVEPGENLVAAAALLDVSIDEIARSLARRQAWPAEALLSMARLARDKFADEQALRRRARGDAGGSGSAEGGSAEVALLTNLIEHLKLSSRDEDLAQMAIAGLAKVVTTRGLALSLLPDEGTPLVNACAGRAPLLMVRGPCPADLSLLDQVVAQSETVCDTGPLVLHAGRGAGRSVDFAGVAEIVLVTLGVNGTRFGWLAAFRLSGQPPFAQTEINLLATVGTIVAVHCENTVAYRQQSELVAGIVHALTSAIDAKDRHTCGHSDRVSRVAVRLGQALGCDAETLKTLYLAGLLHDVGKIGIDDQVLRKPSALTPQEYAHIKTHPEIGYHILVDLKNLRQVLPAVRHHHEAYNGTGYPDGLAGEAIPFTARVIALADAFDAMSNDRPYRKGMCDAELDAALRNGAGRQWDPHLVDVFFSIRDEIRAMAHAEIDAAEQELSTWEAVATTA